MICWALLWDRRNQLAWDAKWRLVESSWPEGYRVHEPGVGWWHTTDEFVKEKVIL